MGYETFATEAEAMAHIREMIGWDAEAVQLHLPDDSKADADGNAWVIQCDGSLFLRDDGYVR